MALRSFPNRYLFSLHSKVTSLFSIRYILEIILRREDYGFDQEEINFKVSESNGVYKLNPESGFTIDGMYINGVLTMTLKTDNGYTLIFSGKKEK